MRRVRFLLLLLLLLGWGAAARAEVWIHFHSKDFASTFPHAFVRLTGTDDSTGQQIDTNYGFTPTSVSPGILMGAVKGMIQTVDQRYVERSDHHFTLRLNEQQYRTVLAVVHKWHSAPQPSYRLNSRNCVHFVAEVAAALGLRAEMVPRLMKKPKSFLRKVTQDNSVLIAQWGAHPPSAPQSAPAPATVAAPPPAPAPAH